MKIGKILKIAGIAFAGYAVGVWSTAYQTARRDDVKEAGEEFADAWDRFKSVVKGESASTEEVAEDITETVSKAAEEVAEAVEEAVSEVVPDITVTTNDSEEGSDQPED